MRCGSRRPGSWIALGVFAIVVPAVLAHEAPAGLFRTAVRNVEGTVWVGSDVCGPQVYRFEPGGILSYSYPDGNGVMNTYRNGTWKQSGSSIYMETNQRFSERKGIIRDREMKGEGWNIHGQKWKWNARKQLGS